MTFTEAEAFLGILSVTSFVNLLLDQMIQQAAYDREKLDTEQHALEIRKHIKSIESLPLLDRTVQLLLEFSRQLRKLDPKSAGTNESQLSGMLHAFLTSFAPEIDVAVQPMLKDASGRISPDFILSQAGDGVLIEGTKYKRLNKKSEELKVQQILRYLRAAKISSGIMFMYSLEPRHIQRYDHVFVDHQYPGYMIVEVRPR